MTMMAIIILGKVTSTSFLTTRPTIKMIEEVNNKTRSPRDMPTMKMTI
jgi:hypothetical protein